MVLRSCRSVYEDRPFSWHLSNEVNDHPNLRTWTTDGELDHGTPSDDFESSYDEEPSMPPTRLASRHAKTEPMDSTRGSRLDMDEGSPSSLFSFRLRLRSPCQVGYELWPLSWLRSAVLEMGMDKEHGSYAAPDLFKQHPNNSDEQGTSNHFDIFVGDLSNEVNDDVLLQAFLDWPQRYPNTVPIKRQAFQLLASSPRLVSCGI